jgi:branched-chain amino acid transport system substrate-binding protein
VRHRLSLLAVLALGCSAPNDNSEIVLGAGGGWTQPYGAMARRGIELAVQELNADGGTRVRIVYKDDQGNGAKAATVAKEFVDGDSSDAVVAVIGHLTSGTMKAAAKVYHGNLPAVATAASSPELTGISPWAFRVIVSDSVSGIEIAKYAASLGKRRAAILYENNSFGRGLADAFSRSFGGQILSMDPISESQDQPFDPFIEWFKVRRPDVVFVAGADKSGLGFVRAARRLGLDADLMGGMGWRGLVSDSVNAEGAWVGMPFTADDSRATAQKFSAAFRTKYKMTPDAGAALAYDATRLLARAAREVGTDRAKIRKWLATRTESTAVDGATGSIRFDAGGDPVGKGMVMTRIRNGALQVATK